MVKRRVNTAMLSKARLLVGCEPVPLICAAAASLSLFVLGGGFNFVQIFIVFITFSTLAWGLRKIATYDPHFFALLVPRLVEIFRDAMNGRAAPHALQGKTYLARNLPVSADIDRALFEEMRDE